MVVPLVLSVYKLEKLFPAQLVGLILSIDTGKAEPGIKAMFLAEFVYGPAIPGPDKKKPNTSFTPAQVNSGYFSELSKPNNPS